MARLSPTPKARVPIYLAARSPNMLEMAGELADGAMLSAPLGYMNFAVERMKVGAKKAGRKLEDINVVNMLPFSVAEDGEKARELVKDGVSITIMFSPPKTWEKAGIKRSEVEAIRKASKTSIEAASKLVTPKMIDEFSIAGTPDYCANRARRFIEAGVDQIVISSPFGPDPKEAIKISGEQIFPSLSTKERPRMHGIDSN